MKQERFTIKQLNSNKYRFYEVSEGVYYPSVTTILDAGVPTGKELIEWFKTNGFMSDYLVKKAAEEGTKVHNAIEELCNGSELEFQRFADNEKLWDMIWKFVVFHTEYVDEILEVEQMGVSHELRTAGTKDLKIRLKDGRKGIVDIKTSNHAHVDKWAMQTMAYKQMCIEEGEDDIDFRAVLHLKARTRGADKTGKKIQGKGWNLIFFNNDKEDLEKFVMAEKTFWMYNPNAKPVFKRYPMKLSLDGTFTLEEYLNMKIGEDEEYES